MKRFRIKYLKSINRYVLHVQKPAGGRKKAWRRQWGVDFSTESQARKYADGNF